MKVTTIGIDLAKSVFQIHGVDARGKTVLRKRLGRAEMVTFFANFPPCLIGMEACGSAHHWARKLASFGHDVKLMAPQFVKPYVKTNKNDVADAEAICEAVARPNMRFVAVKTVDQQAILSVHRVRAGLVKSRTAVANQIRGLLAEFGIVIPRGINAVVECLPKVVDEDSKSELPAPMRGLMRGLLEQLKNLSSQVDALETQIKHWHREDETSRKLEAIPGIGPLTASALIATIGDARSFKNGRQLAAWLGLVPKQCSSGGKSLLLGISKRGDAYLRTLLIHGARSVVRVAESKIGEVGWLDKLLVRRNKNIATVALANKNARIVWALLAHGQSFKPGYTKASTLAMA